MLSDNNFIHINSNININTKAKANLDKDITRNNFYKKTLELRLKTYFNKFKTRLHISNW